MVYAAGDAQEARVEAEDDAIYIEGRVGGELGWFLLHPLHEVVLLDGNVFDVLAARSDQPKDATAPLIVRDVELGGVLRADRFKFYRGVDLPKRPGRRILGHIGVDALRSCCVALDQAKPALQILPAGSFTGDDFLPMCTVHQHRAFACELRGGLRSWCIVVPGERNDAFVQPIDYDRFAAASRSGEGPLEDGALAWIDIANQRLKVEHTWRLGVHDRTTVDETPIAIGTKSLSGMVLEMDFPNDRYRFRER